MFSIHTTKQPTVTLDLCYKKTRAGKSRDYHDVIALEKLRLQNVAAFSNTSGVVPGYFTFVLSMIQNATVISSSLVSTYL